MSNVGEVRRSEIRGPSAAVPTPVLAVFRGIGQVFFQENAATGVCFALGIAFGSPLMALGAVVGSTIGLITARIARFDSSEIDAGIHGFNSALVGIATFFYFKPAGTSVLLMVAGCVVAALITRPMRKHAPFPTYTSPFILTTWILFLIGPSLGTAWAEPLAPSALPEFLGAVIHGISQVMFQASLGTGILFLVGIGLSDRRHAVWVVVASALGALVASHHVTAASRALDPEQLIVRLLSENIALGLYGYNATLSAIALSLWRRSLALPLLGILLSVPLTELVPLVGLPALTSPFVLATWLVLGIDRLEGAFHRHHEAFGP